MMLKKIIHLENREEDLIPLKTSFPNSEEEEKEIIRKKLSTKISADGWLITNDQSSRSQLDNKKAAIAKLYKMLDKCFVVAKKRKATKPSKGSKEKRLQTKKIRSEIKAGRKLRAE